MTGLLAACGGDDSGDDEGGGAEPGATHAEALTALAGTGSACAIASCHGSTAEAMLELAGATNLRELLVVPSCEAPALKLVEPGDPSKSWLWIKLTGKTSDSRGTLVPQSSWGTAGTNCGAAGFGTKMPQVSGNDWDPARLEVLESWIKGGAPGPT